MAVFLHFAGASKGAPVAFLAGTGRNEKTQPQGLGLWIEADGGRTRNHRIDSPVLYPIELRPHTGGTATAKSVQYIFRADIVNPD